MVINHSGQYPTRYPGANLVEQLNLDFFDFDLLWLEPFEFFLLLRNWGLQVQIGSIVTVFVQLECCVVQLEPEFFFLV